MRKKADFYTLKNTVWKDIKIGEVFALKGCWGVLAKLSDSEAMLLAFQLTNDEANGWGDNQGQCELHIGKVRTLVTTWKSLFSNKVYPTLEFTDYKGEACYCLKTDADVANKSLFKLPLSMQRLFNPGL